MILHSFSKKKPYAVIQKVRQFRKMPKDLSFRVNPSESYPIHQIVGLRQYT